MTQIEMVLLMSSLVPQGYHSHIRSKLLSVRVYSIQQSEEITPFQSITVVLRHNEKTRKTISINGHILPCIHEKNINFS